MKRAGWVLLLIGGALGLLPGAAEAQFLRFNPSFTKKDTPPILQSFRSLAGCWKGRAPHGGSVRLFYELVSDGTAMVEYLRPVGTTTPQMTVYYLDGDTAMAHHFCFFGSQVRMKAEPTTDPKVLRFKFLDATNLTADQHENHMTYIKFTFTDPDHIEADWGQWDRGREYPGYFSFTRVVEGCKGLDFTW
jgi:hypothetical protein